MDQPTNGINPYLYALSIVSGKWKMSILNHIHYYDFIRFSKTKKTFPISEKVLSQQLKGSDADKRAGEEHKAQRQQPPPCDAEPAVRKSAGKDSGRKTSKA